MFTYAGFITLTPEGRDTIEKAAEFRLDGTSSSGSRLAAP